MRDKDSNNGNGSGNSNSRSSRNGQPGPDANPTAPPGRAKKTTQAPTSPTTESRAPDIPSKTTFSPKSSKPGLPAPNPTTSKEASQTTLPPSPEPQETRTSIASTELLPLDTIPLETTQRVTGPAALSPPAFSASADITTQDVAPPPSTILPLVPPMGPSSSTSSLPTSTIGPTSTERPPNSINSIPNGDRQLSSAAAIAIGVIVGLLVIIALGFLPWKYRRYTARARIVSRFRRARERMQTSQRHAARSDPSMSECLLGNEADIETGSNIDYASPLPYWDSHQIVTLPQTTPVAIVRPRPVLHRSVSRLMRPGRNSIRRVKAVEKSLTKVSQPPPGFGGVPEPMAIEQDSSALGGDNNIPLFHAQGVAEPIRPQSEAASTTADPHSATSATSSPTFRSAGDRRTNHSGWSEWFRNTPPEAELQPGMRRRSSVGSIGGTSVASSGVLSPAFRSWPIASPTPTTASIVGLIVDGAPETRNGGSSTANSVM
ncbi:hypothetical protein BGZ61DRAFT_463576 [Ilyonectria robusta]|uniref:uncharacterized protein n=1 Tax=Ilyonectria robusta TaxID=1079257 RepID=UPI001E8E1446|nr:uncharacterized protein BGZ61DRAFT_463576 [Ilyonectria robusta]KAH8661752.1 hypothetical protein BGZ61DRAFT_463576 [Ilyonectria robusta]